MWQRSRPAQGWGMLTCRCRLACRQPAGFPPGMGRPAATLYTCLAWSGPSSQYTLVVHRLAM